MDLNQDQFTDKQSVIQHNPYSASDDIHHQSALPSNTVFKCQVIGDLSVLGKYQQLD